MSWEKIVSLLQSILGGPVPVQREALEVNVRMLKNEAWPDPSYKIQNAISKGVRLLQEDPTQAGIRDTQNRELKKRLGGALWALLLGEEHFPKQTFRQPSSAGLAAKVAQFRRKHAPSLWIDAGSTTLLAVHQLLLARHFPLLVTDMATGHAMPLRPLFVTNSYKVAEAIGASRHHLDLRVRLVGGELKINLKSCSGFLTERCMEAWQMRGDVAIVGATGLRHDEEPIAFCCDDLEEADLKSRFLRSCWFRIVIADSSKIAGPDKATATQAFASLDPHSVDLIVLDDGVETKRTQEVSWFLEKAYAAGVACLIVGQPANGTGNHATLGIKPLDKRSTRARNRDSEDKADGGGDSADETE